ncbi:hypothetical protein GJ496_010335 [Pomphorhynchus laevis]|nr:hypothetical protein GJ496_010335 [Pomphorhynchus laevis]
MVRKLRYHEQKLLKKFDFISWEVDSNTLHENDIMRKYCIPKREEYTLYNQLSREIRNMAEKIVLLDQSDVLRTELTKLFLDKLYDIGLISHKQSLEVAAGLNASSFCRRRLPVVMKRSGMAESIKQCSQYVEQGHVRVGIELITDPAYLVTREMEDFITWVDNSSIRKKIDVYNDIDDDFENE